MLQPTVRLISFHLLALLLAVVATASPRQAPRPLTNDDVIKMVNAGLPEGTIVSAIQASPTNFDISADALISLKNAGVSQPVMDAMIATTSNKRTAGAPVSSGASAAPAPALSSQLRVDLLPSAPAPGAAASQIAVLMIGEKTQLAETKTKPSSLGRLAGDSTLNQGMQSGVNTAAWETLSHTSGVAGGVASSEAGNAGNIVGGIMAHRSSTLTYVWAVPGANSANVNVPARGATFAVTFAGVSGVNPDEYEPAVVKLTSTSNNWRLVGATQGKENARNSSTLDWQMYSGFVEDRVPAQSRKLGSGQYQISPTGTLAPGEYAIVLRPVSKEKKFSGSDVAGNLGSGLIFNSIWSFEIR